MRAPLTLSLRRQLDDKIELTVTPVGGLPEQGTVSAAALLRALPPPPRPAGFVIPGQDSLWSSWEAAVGAQLSRALADAGAAGRVFQAAIAEARAAGDALWIGISTEGEGLSQLPWELLADPLDGVPLEPAARGVVVRLLRVAPGARSEEPTARPAVGLWCPTPEDPACQQRVQALCAAHGEGIVGQTQARRLHIVTHGSVDPGTGLLGLADDGDMAPGTVVHGFLGSPRPEVVVLEVCHGALATAALSGLAGHLLGAGVQAVIGPALPMTTRALATFAAAFHASQLDGHGVPAAVVEGRSALRRLGRGSPSERWWLPALWTPRLLVPLAARAPSLPGLPASLPGDTCAWLERAAQLATAAGTLGLEHLLVALLRPELAALPQGPAVQALRRATALASPDPLQPWCRLRYAPDADGALRFTPRLRALLAQLPPRATPEQLAQAIVQAWNAPLGRRTGVHLADVPSHSESSITEAGSTPSPIHQSNVPAVAFELIGGPEDGRQLRLQPGERIGRASRQHAVEHVLYAEGPVDTSCSRYALSWEGPGQAVLHRPARVGLPPGWTEERGPVRLLEGTVVELGAVTWLWCRGE